MTESPRILVVGAGPTGIGAAWRLMERGHANWHLFEATDGFGGLAASEVDAQGFTWDYGGHVLFSHYRYFDALMTRALGDAWVEHEREAWVWMRERWIPYPFQNNLWRLDASDVRAAIEGLEEAAAQTTASRPRHFGDWLMRAFGPGLCDLFMVPYNRKVWAYDPSRLGVGWMGERVATVDLARVRQNVALRRDDVSWGPNATFRFPQQGGTGAIWRSLGRQLPAANVSFGKRVTSVDVGNRTLRFSDGSVERYDVLISSIPLDDLLRGLSGASQLSAHADRFVYSSSHIIGVGFEGPVPDALRTKCWMYFPESDTPFYRATVFSNYSANNVALPGRQWSLMAEVSESPDKPVDRAGVVRGVIDGFRNARFIDGSQPIVTTWQTRLEHGYPTPWLERDDILAEVLPGLRAAGIYSRGRFGAWKYEVSNQDHSTMQGVEAVDHILAEVPETTVEGRMNAEPPVVARQNPMTESPLSLGHRRT